jgi:hypothetical protein
VTVVDVQLVPVVPGAAEDPLLVGRLARAEREAVALLGFAADRDRAVTARAAARLELGRRLGLHPRAVPLLAPEATGGQPAVPGTTIGISWAHSGSWIALAFARGRPVGVDVEVLSERVPVKALARLGLGSLRDFVAREAAGKATGQGLGEAWPPGVSVRPFATPAGYLGAVAAPGFDWTVRLHSPEAGDPPALASVTAAGLWDADGAGARRAAARICEGCDRH